MARNPENAGLTVRYRVGWRLTYMLLHVGGPPTMDADRDPRRLMRRERAEKVRRLHATEVGHRSGSVDVA